MADYIIRKVPTAVWAKFKARAASEGRSFVFVLHRLIDEYIRHGLRKD
jgi:plasmid stability protein